MTNLFPSVKPCGCMTHCNCRISVKSYIVCCLYLIAAFIIIFGGSSCNIQKKINRLKTTEEKINNLVTAFSATTTERIDTTIAISTASVEATKELDRLIEGDSIHEDTPELTITTKVIKGRVFTKAIRKPVFVPVKLDRTVTSNSISVDKGSVKTTTKTVVKDVERTGGFDFNYVWWIVGILSVGLFIVIGIKKKWFKEETPTV